MLLTTKMPKITTILQNIFLKFQELSIACYNITAPRGHMHYHSIALSVAVV